MPTKKTATGRSYATDGKTFTWTTDEGVELGIPLRIKLRVIRQLANEDPENVATMFLILEQIIPGQAEALDEMDVNDFTAMFAAWNDEYTSMTGANLGESSRSTG
jgi:hypothetical protein